MQMRHTGGGDEPVHRYGVCCDELYLWSQEAICGEQDGPMIGAGVAQRNNVKLLGRRGGQPMVFGHGFGTDQTMWDQVHPAFTDRYEVVLFDHVGSGAAAPTDADDERHGSLWGYADDLLEVYARFDLHGSVYVGHSVGAMIGVLAAIRDPERFASLVLIGPSPRYIDAEDYVGGFSRADVDGLLDAIEADWAGWTSAMAPALLGGDEGAQAGELAGRMQRTDGAAARRFAEVIFNSDHRADLSQLGTPSLIVQSMADIVSPAAVGDYLHRHLAESQLTTIRAMGHFPHLSAPEQTIAAIQDFVG
jgi:sigma-B regulation protein RsbQ